MSKTNIGEIWSIVRNMAKTDTEFREAIREIINDPMTKEDWAEVMKNGPGPIPVVPEEPFGIPASRVWADLRARSARLDRYENAIIDALGNRYPKDRTADSLSIAVATILEYRNHLCAKDPDITRLAEAIGEPEHAAVDKAIDMWNTDCEGCEGGKIVTELPAGYVTIEAGELNRLRGIAARIDSVERDRSHYRDKAEDEERRRLEVEAALGNIFKVLMRDYGVTPTSSENTATLAVRFLTEYKHSAHSPGTAEFLDKIIQLSTANAMLGQQFEDARLRVNALPSQQMFDDAMSRVRELEERFGSIALAMQELGIEQKDWMTNRSSQDLEQEPLHEAVIRHLRSAYGDEPPTDG